MAAPSAEARLLGELDRQDSLGRAKLLAAKGLLAKGLLAKGLLAKRLLAKRLLLLLELRHGLERQEAAQLAGKAADGLAKPLVAERAADGPADRRPILFQQVAEEALWRELLLAERRAELLAAKGLLTKRLLAKRLLLELRHGLERQEAAQLAGKTADGLAKPLVAECAANGPADRRAILLQQVAEEALRCELLLLLKRRAELLAAKGLLTKRLLLLLELRHGLERQEAAQLAGKAADGLAKPLVAEQVADGAANRRAVLLQQVAEEALRCELLLLKRRAELLAAKGLLTKRLLTKRLLLLELRHGLERQEAAQLAGKAADGLAEPLVAKGAADGSADRRAILLQQVAEEALRRELLLQLLKLLQLLQLLQLVHLRKWLLELGLEFRRGLEGQETAQNAAKGAAHGLPRALVAEEPAYRAAGQTAKRASQKAAAEALRRILARSVEDAIGNRPIRGLTCCHVDHVDLFFDIKVEKLL
ncbi:hypothetical protein [Pedomonas mirosovicensis]|uniref:hypothetical protein n=1 Tax=Pedomonas mirosovicensis TaxID=2908641 RepID=UPI002169012A|nr:hypothetical protein [Pedomonas mirosovicensis]MCH8684225.1 hypothetical protein [Pedomonas mirosovicensis]